MLVPYIGEKLTYKLGDTCEIMCVSPTETLDWSKDLFDRDGTPTAPELISVLDTFLAPKGVEEVLAPSVGYQSGSLAYAHQLNDHLALPSGIMLHRNRDLPADGVLVKTRQAFMMVNGGCPLVIGSAAGIVIAGHAARESLLDRALILTGHPSRPCVSIVHAIVQSFKQMHFKLDEITITILFGLPTLPFVHPVDDPSNDWYNRKMVDFVLRHWGSGIIVDPDGKAHLSITHLAKAQARKLGIENVVIQHALPEDGVFAYTRHTEDELRTKRNLILLWRS